MPSISNTQVAQYASGALNIAIWIIGTIVAAGLVGGIAYFWMQMKRYNQFKVVVWEKDGFGHITERYDKAGIFLDRKTKNKRFFMKRAKVGLSPDNVPYIQVGKKRIVYLYRTGLKNFRYIKPHVDDTNFHIEVGEEDVNWGLNAFDRGQKTFATSQLMQLMPYIAIAFVSIIILVIFIYFFKDFGTLRDMAVAMKEAAATMAQIQSGTTVLP